MGGFFTIEQTQSKERPNGKIYSCASCGLYKYVLSPRMKPFGNFKKGILNIGEAPGEKEDRKGRQWQGKVGKRLQQEYAHLGFDLFEDCLNINTINCRPTDKKGNNRPPTSDEIVSCRAHVLKVIQEYQPRVIVVLGSSAISSIIGHRWRKDLGGIAKWRGWTIPDRDFNAWVCPVWHPSYVDRLNGKEIDVIWRQDLKRALSLHTKALPKWRDEKELVEIIDSPSQLSSFSNLVAIDYETTGLKPHASGHRIVCAAVAHNENTVQVFPMPEDKISQQPFLDRLRDPIIGKMAHHMKFEEMWSTIYLKQPVKNWKWDSMLAAHLLDNRSYTTGLKFQVYVNFGVVNYNGEVEKYLKGKDSKNANSMNRVLELIKTERGRRQLYTYCGLDALYEYRLAMKQMEIIGEYTS